MQPTDTAAKRQLILGSVGELRVQLNLLEACVQAGRDEWAAQTYAAIRQLVDGAQPLFGTAGPALPAPTAVTSSTGAQRKTYPPPTVEELKTIVLSMIGELPLVSWQGPLIVCTFNGYLLNEEKANRWIDVYMELVKRAHVVLLQETNVAAARVIAKAARYGLNASHRNLRQQANCILFHPRLRWLGDSPVYHDYLLDVPGHPEYKETLRPALQRRVVDRVTGFVFDLIDFHAKSNVGGPEETRPIRRYQFEQLVLELQRQEIKSPYSPRPQASNVDPAASVKTEAAAGGTDTAQTSAETSAEASAETSSNTAAVPPLPVLDYAALEQAPLGALILGGDFNAPLEKATTTEIEPLTQFGLTLHRTPDDRWTHDYRGSGGMFDGFFSKGLDGKAGQLFIPKFPEHKVARAIYGKHFSDHLPGFLQVNV